VTERKGNRGSVKEDGKLRIAAQNMRKAALSK